MIKSLLVVFLVVFLGFPDSGKTYFAKQLAKKLNAVTLNTDALRLSMFGSLETIDKFRVNDKTRLYSDVFGAMDYAARQTLLAGHSVIYDAQQTKRKDRHGIEKIAHESGAVPILVWIKTSRESALKRGQNREVANDSHQYTSEKMEYLIDRFDSVTDLPELSENTVTISGEISFEEQYRSFQKQIEKLTEIIATKYQSVGFLSIHV